MMTKNKITYYQDATYQLYRVSIEVICCAMTTKDQQQTYRGYHTRKCTMHAIPTIVVRHESRRTGTGPVSQTVSNQYLADRAENE
jgi:hypothetical protein